MSDDKTNRGTADRTRVAGGEGYEADYFERQHGITADEVRSLVDRIDNDREKLDAAAERLKT